MALYLYFSAQLMLDLRLLQLAFEEHLESHDVIALLFVRIGRIEVIAELVAVDRGRAGQSSF